MPLSSGQVPGNCLFPRNPPAPTTTWACGLDSSSTQSNSHIWSPGGSCKESLPSYSSCMAAGSHWKYSMSGPSFGKGPSSRSVEGCPAAWSSSNIYSGSWKVTHQCGLVGLGLGTRFGYLPQLGPYSIFGSASGPSS